MQLVDSHCHLTMDHFQSDRDQVVERARVATVTRIVIPGIDLSSSRKAVEFAEADDGLFAAIGFHPSAADQWRPESAEELRQLSASSSVVAIGEIGLDYYHEDPPVDIQKMVLENQLALAAELDLPVILHNRESVAELLDILSNWRGGLPENRRDRAGVLHAFDGTIGQAQSAIEIGFFLGIGGPITFKNAADKRELVKQLPLDRILVETDAPYLTPQPHRGERNEPAYTRLVAEALAVLHQSELGMVARKTTDNAETLFGWSNGIKNSDVL